MLVSSKPRFPAEHAGFRHVVTPHQVLALRASQQVAVIRHRQRVTLRNTRRGAPLPVGADEDRVGLVQRGQEVIQFEWDIVPIKFQVQITTVNTAVLIA